jgi:hypothetical protein
MKRREGGNPAGYMKGEQFVNWRTIELLNRMLLH